MNKQMKPKIAHKVVTKSEVLIPLKFHPTTRHFPIYSVSKFHRMAPKTISAFFSERNRAFASTGLGMATTGSLLWNQVMMSVFYETAPFILAH